MAFHLGILLLTVSISVDKTCGCSPDLPDLRRFSVYGYGGFFSITEEDFQDVIDERLVNSGWTSVNLYPRDDGPEFSIYLSNVKDTTLKDSGFVPNDYNEIAISLPVKVGTVGDAPNGDLQLGHFTVTEDTLNPYLVNYARTVVINQLNITEEAYSVTWSIKDEIGELEIIVERRSDGQQDLKYALRKRNADEEYTLKTDFPNKLYWGCDKIPVQSQPHFCSVLSDHSSEIAAAGEHISNINTVLPDDSDDDGGVTYVMRITKITGYFQTILPFAQVDQESLFAFRGISHESVGIAYNCIKEK